MNSVEINIISVTVIVMMDYFSQALRFGDFLALRDLHFVLFEVLHFTCGGNISLEKKLQDTSKTLLVHFLTPQRI